MSIAPVLTILMPCLNEEETIERCISKSLASLESLKIPGEVLIADNGSTDRSVAIAEAAGARVVHVIKKGYGNALRGGIESTAARWVIMADADDSYDFSKLEPFVSKLEEGYDLVMGCRMPRGGGTVMPGAMPWKHRWIGNPVLTAIGKLFFHCPINDFHCGLRGFSMEAYRKMELRTTGMEFASEMVIKATMKDLRMAEVPITLHKDGRLRPPHLRSWRDGWRHLRFMLLFAPNWLFLYPGLALIISGGALLTALVFQPLVINQVRLDTNTMLVAGLALLLGFQVLSFALFTKLSGVAKGLLPESRRILAFKRIFNLERGLILGLLIVGIGGLLLGIEILNWKNQGFGDLSYSQSLRTVIPAVIGLALGTQVLFSSFFLGILNLDTR